MPSSPLPPTTHTPLISNPTSSYTTQYNVHDTLHASNHGTIDRLRYDTQLYVRAYIQYVPTYRLSTPSAGSAQRLSCTTMQPSRPSAHPKYSIKNTRGRPFPLPAFSFHADENKHERSRTALQLLSLSFSSLNSSPSHVTPLLPHTTPTPYAPSTSTAHAVYTIERP